ncbi:MAG: hypothetical protein IBJ00_07835, partial [Alphaproteobacteria bacterium]|nr:hypothetical protein [Alphaproteobacteria bacterium]
MWRSLSLFIVLLTLSACSKEKAPLEGTREVVLLNENVLTPSGTLKDLKVEVPAARLNRHWPQAGGEPDHSTPPLKLCKNLKIIWEASIGSGSHATGRLLTEPVIYNGKIFAFNTNAEVRALDAVTGETLWETSVVPENSSGTSL